MENSTIMYDSDAVLVYAPPVKTRGPAPELLKYHSIGSVLRCSDNTYWEIRVDPRGERYFTELKDKAIDEVLIKIRKPR